VRQRRNLAGDEPHEALWVGVVGVGCRTTVSAPASAQRWMASATAGASPTTLTSWVRSWPQAPVRSPVEETPRSMLGKILRKQVREKVLLSL